MRNGTKFEGDEKLTLLALTSFFCLILLPSGAPFAFMCNKRQPTIERLNELRCWTSYAIWLLNAFFAILNCVSLCSNVTSFNARDLLFYVCMYVLVRVSSFCCCCCCSVHPLLISQRVNSSLMLSFSAFTQLYCIK